MSSKLCKFGCGQQITWDVGKNYFANADGTNRPYGEKDSWVKMRSEHTVDCFITGYYFTDTGETSHMPRNRPPSSFWIAVYDIQGGIISIGRVSAKGVYYPIGTVLEVKYQEVIQGSNALRFPRILRVRTDKAREECLYLQLTN